jgi:hypothetical protein
MPASGPHEHFVTLFPPAQAKAKAHAKEQEQQVAALQALLLKQREAQHEDTRTAQAITRQLGQYRERCEALLIARTLLQEEVIAHLKVTQGTAIA